MKMKNYVGILILMMSATSGAALVNIPFFAEPLRSGTRAPSSKVRRQVTAAEEASAALTEYMAKAHEEKLRAMADVEAKFKDRIVELEGKVAELEASNSSSDCNSVEEGNNGSGALPNVAQQGSYLFPATNKDLTEKVEAYRKFISDYIVSAQMEKLRSVKESEDKMKAHYGGIIEKLQTKESQYE
mmetsp:Transcript_4857/g.7175  ORF Transcript_4857/g.7175 Transcript_4857/m.7175 type:complete len:186 (+) Transcript_4857:90-647(+)